MKPIKRETPDKNQVIKHMLEFDASVNVLRDNKPQVRNYLKQYFPPKQYKLDSDLISVCIDMVAKRLNSGVSATDTSIDATELHIVNQVGASKTKQMDEAIKPKCVVEKKSKNLLNNMYTARLVKKKKEAEAKQRKKMKSEILAEIMNSEEYKDAMKDEDEDDDEEDTGKGIKRTFSQSFDDTEDDSKSRKKKKSNYLVLETPKERYEHFGGIDTILREIQTHIELPFRYPDVYRMLGVEPIRGILFYGPPGTGKTMLANAIAAHLAGVSYFKVAAPEIISGVSGQAERHIRNLFRDAVAAAPSLIFIDEIDTIAPKKEQSSRGMEKRIVAQIQVCLDELSFLTTNKLVMVVGATATPDAIDPSLRRAGRFAREITLGIPSEKAREQILVRLSKGLRLEDSFDVHSLAKMTPGYVGADLRSITKEAATHAISRVFDTVMDAHQQLPNPESEYPEIPPEMIGAMSIKQSDFEYAVKKVQPSAQREGFTTVPNVTWDDVGALVHVKKELQRAITHPIEYPDIMKKLNIKPSSGVLLYGPPGVGKTLVAKAIANQSRSNFISVKGPELLNKYVGESERAVRMVFNRAKASAPCIIFFDELDALAPQRGKDSANPSSQRVVNQLLTEMDGMEARKQVFVIAATNRPDIIDAAMLRPGRLDRCIFVPIPDESSRLSILKTITRNTPLADDVKLEYIASKTVNYTGADLSALLREASINSFENHLPELVLKKQAKETPNLDAIKVTAENFNTAFANITPSVSDKDRAAYDRLQRKMSAS